MAKHNKFQNKGNAAPSPLKAGIQKKKNDNFGKGNKGKQIVQQMQADQKAGQKNVSKTQPKVVTPSKNVQPTKNTKDKKPQPVEKQVVIAAQSKNGQGNNKGKKDNGQNKVDAKQQVVVADRSKNGQGKNKDNGQNKVDAKKQNGQNKNGVVNGSQARANVCPEKKVVNTVEVPSGKKQKADVKKVPFNPKVSFTSDKKRNTKVDSESELDDEELDEDLSDEEMDVEDEDSIDSEEDEEENKKPVKASEKQENKTLVKAEKTQPETKAVKRLAEVAVTENQKKAKLDEDVILKEEERRRKDRDSRALVVVLEGKQKKATDSMIKALHPDILNLVRTRRVAFLHFPSESVAERAHKAIGNARIFSKKVAVDFCGQKAAKNSKSDQHESGVLDRLRLVVTGLPRDINKEKIQVIFSKCKDIYLDYKKQMAYLRFPSQVEAKEAFEKSKNMKIGGAPVTVQFKKTQQKQAPTVEVKADLAEKKAEKKVQEDGDVADDSEDEGSDAEDEDQLEGLEDFEDEDLDEDDE